MVAQYNVTCLTLRNHMAYCRNTGINSEVYLYKGFNGKFYFHLSRKANGTPTFINFVKDNTKKALDKLDRLRRQGYKIPDYAFERLKQELKDNGST